MNTLVQNTQKVNREKLNKDISLFSQVAPVTKEMKTTFKGVSRLVMIDRYAFKDTKKLTLGVGDFVSLTVKPDPKFPAKGLGYVLSVNEEKKEATILVEEDYRGSLEEPSEVETGIVVRSLDTVEKPLEIYWEQIAIRVARGLSSVEKTKEEQEFWFNEFLEELRALNFIPAGRVLYGAGSETDVTYFNCYVMPFIQDSRDGISEHRKQVMEIMSRGGGVGTNGSTLRPRHALARGVNGRSSGSVSWLDDIAKLTHLVEQGGSRKQLSLARVKSPELLESPKAV